MAFGLLGRKLGHSFSPRIHSMFGDVPYALYEKEPEELAAFLHEPGITGLNVTIPYKKTVMPYCTQIDEEAKRIGAVNTLVRTNDGRGWRGCNTDADGFRFMMRESGFDFRGKTGLILGDGGASATVQYVLAEAGASYTVLSRKGEHPFEEAAKHADAAFVVNTTPVGMFPENGSSLIDLDSLPACRCVLDLIYNPLRTKLVLDALDRGMKAVGGLGMLVAQAKRSAELFTGRPVSDAVLQSALLELRSEVENVVLIGMPGCGKSTITRILAGWSGREYADSDDVFAATYGQTPAACITAEGEKAFRDKEEKIIAELAKRTGILLATGGGVVTRENNRHPLRQNGKILWIQRDLHRLSSAGRPLSQATDPDELYQRRRGLYETFADGIVVNDGTSAEAAQKVIEIMKKLTERE